MHFLVIGRLLRQVDIALVHTIPEAQAAKDHAQITWGKVHRTHQEVYDTLLK